VSNTIALILALLALAAFIPLSALAAPGRLGFLPVLFGRRARRWYRHLAPRNGQRSSYCPPRFRGRILRADRRRCVYCRSTYQLQVDHIVPWSLGGMTSLWNCAVLCGTCNRVKSAYWVSPAGTVYYRPFKDASDVATAAAIVAAERAARRNPWRWLRAYL
jgi:5-methylcytosine-specific restriction endonuclease McrA